MIIIVVIVGVLKASDDEWKVMVEKAHFHMARHNRVANLGGFH